jgi:hypothetical protein
VVENFGARVGRKDKNQTNVSGVVESEQHDWPKFFFCGGMRVHTEFQPLSVKTYIMARHWHDKTGQDTVRCFAFLLVKLNYI